MGRVNGTPVKITSRAGGGRETWVISRQQFGQDGLLSKHGRGSLLPKEKMGIPPKDTILTQPSFFEAMAR